MNGAVQKDSQKDKSLSVEPRWLEVVSGPTGRRRWPAREKARIVCESFRGDASVCAVARRNGIRPNQLFLWRRLAREGKLVLPGEAVDELAFAAVVVAEDGNRRNQPEIDGPRGMEIEADGVVVRINERTPADRIGEIAAALRGPR